MDHIKFYHQRFLNSVDVSDMSASLVGAYILLLLNSIDQSPAGYLPADMELLRKTSRLPNNSWKLNKDTLLKKFTYSETHRGYFNETLLNVIEKKQRLSDKRRNAAKNRGKSKEERIVVKEKANVSVMMLEVHKIQEYVDKHFINIKKIENQLTYKQCCMLREQYSEELIVEKLKKMENTKNLNTKYTNVFITLEDWCKNEVLGKGNYKI